MPPTPLTDLASVRAFMQTTDLETGQDADIEALIPQVSLTIENFTNREFGSAAATKRSFETRFDGSEILLLNPYEIRTVTAVVVDPEENSGTTIDPSMYRLWPFPARDGTFFGLRIVHHAIPARIGHQHFHTRRIDVTGDWGMAEIPDDIKHYANQTVESWLHLRRDAGLGQSESDLEEPQARPDELPPGVRWELKARWMYPSFPQ